MKKPCFNGAVVLVVVLCLRSWLPISAQADDADTYRKVLESRAADAMEKKDVQSLVQAAFALYPIETAAKESSPKYVKLLVLASDIVLKSKKAADAREFVELVGPLAPAIPEKKRDQLTSLALGKPLEKLVSEEAKAVGDEIKKRGVLIVDPEVKTRGDREIAEYVGKSALWIVRPITMANQKPGYPQFVSHNMSFPGTNRAHLKVQMKFNGGFIQDNVYTAYITVRLYADRSSLRCDGIDYLDFATPAPDTRLLQQLVTEVNRLLSGG